MRAATHAELADFFSACIAGGAFPHLEFVAKRTGVCLDTLVCIYAQEVTDYCKVNNNALRQAVLEFAPRYFEAGVGLEELPGIARFPPCLVLRRLLEASGLGLGREQVTAALRAPAALEAAAAARGAPGLAPAQAAARAAQLCADILRVADADPAYSPQADLVRHVSGLEHEAVLAAKLRARGITFWSEASLRAGGFHKTPDVRLQVPILISGSVVHWIDSKATFGSERVHTQMAREQYAGYVNRYGPGAALYWFGFVAELQAASPDVLLLDGFPPDAELTMLPTLPVAHLMFER